MSLKDCIDSALAQGHITRDEAAQLKKRYDALASTILDPVRVKGQLTAEIAAESAERKRKAGLSESARKRVDADLDGHRNARGKKDMAEAFRLMHENAPGGKIKDSEFGGRLAILSAINAQIEAALYEFRRGAVVGDLRRTSGFVGDKKTQARMRNVVRELFGESSGDDAAKAFARTFSDAMEDLRVRFNDAGGSIGKLEKWGLPQSHNQEALLNVGQKKWVDRLMQPGVLDRDRTIHQLTKQKLSDAELREFLDHAWLRITTDGWVDREASGVPTGRSSLASQHADHRVIHFKNADAWMKYAEEFGRPDAYEALMNHINTMARDIAHMERWGPNPPALREYAKQRLMKEAYTAGGDAINEATKAIHRADAMWEVQRGSSSAPVGGTLANTMANVRNIISASALGSAVLSAVSDASSGGVARAFVGMGKARAEPIRVIAETIKYMGVENRREAVRSGLILDSSLHIMHKQARYTGSIDTRSLTGFLADRVIAAQGLNAWTQAAKHAFGMSMQAMFADHVRTPWAQLPEMVQRTLDRHGFDEASWSRLSNVPLYEPKPGATFLRPAELHRVVDRDLAERYTAMILRETRHAVMEATVESQAVMRGGTKPGTLVGELVRGFGQFKSFPAAVIMLQHRRIAQEFQSGHKGTGAAYAGTLLISSTLMGLVAMALKDVKDGRDPRRWIDPNNPVYVDPSTWGAAILQGGGMGIYGDFLFANANRHGGGLAQTVAGPMWDRAGAIKDLTWGNAQQLYEGKPTRFAAEASKVIRQNTPGQNLWFLNLAYNRMVADQVQSMIDPDAHKAFRRQIQSRRKDYNQSYWWEPGESSPSRAPNLGAIIGKQ